MDELTDSGGETVQRALAAERLRSARVLGLLRFVGISIACALNLLLPAVVLETRTLQADVRLFAARHKNQGTILRRNLGAGYGSVYIFNSFGVKSFGELVFRQGRVHAG